MATYEHELAPPPTDARTLWLQNAAGFILVEDVRNYARKKLPASLTEAERAIAHRAIDDALYGLMMVADGVSGSLSDDAHAVRVKVAVELREDDRVVEDLDLTNGDGVCMAYHAWRAGDFGETSIVRR